MKRAVKVLLLAGFAAGLAFAQGSEGGEGSLKIWEWVNFLLLAGGLGYVAAKSLPAMFAARSAAILQGLTDAEKVRKDAELRAADAGRRLDGLQAEIAALREDSMRESAAEAERVKQHTAAEIVKIQTHSEREIAAAGKAARMELKRYAASLAVDLAEKRIRERMTPAAEDGLVRGFVHDLK